jgi:hypothetical protein
VLTGTVAATLGSATAAALGMTGTAGPGWKALLVQVLFAAVAVTVLLGRRRADRRATPRPSSPAPAIDGKALAPRPGAKPVSPKGESAKRRTG